MMFRSLFKSQTELDPLTRNFTLASIGMEYFKPKILKCDLIGITPIKGYSAERMKSITSYIWLDWKEKISEKKIIREYPIGKYFADGFIVDEKVV